MRSSDEVQLNRKASLLDGASDSEDEDERPLQQSQQEDDLQQAAEVSSHPLDDSLLAVWCAVQWLLHRQHSTR